MAASSRAIDALVVGAGPVGLTMAAGLARHGLHCRIVDKNAARTDKSKALVLWPRSLEMLYDMGPVEQFVAAGVRVTGARIFGEGREIVRVKLTAMRSPYKYALMLPQSETERLLEAHLETFGLGVERGVELTRMAVGPEGVACALRRNDGTEERLTCAWLLGCDGADSTVRHALGIEFAGAPEPHDWMLADVRVDGPLPADEVRIYLHADGILALFPIAPGRFRVVADVGLTRSGERPDDPTLAEVQALVDIRGPGGLTLSAPAWLAGFRINERKVARYRSGRVFLVGDAAHVHSPAGGQGMNTGMQDAYNLAWKVGLVHAGRGRAPILLDSYDFERGAVGEMVLRTAGAMTRVATLRSPAAQRLRNHLAPLLAALGFVQERVRATLGELAVHYRTSALVKDDRGLSLRARALGGVVAAGDRAPDARLIEAAGGRPTRLFELTRGTAHTLLLLAGRKATVEGLRELVAVGVPARERYADVLRAYLVAPNRLVVEGAGWPGAVLYDADGRLHKQFGAGNRTVVCIRPDGYVSYYGQSGKLWNLLLHLESYMIPAA